MHGIVIPEGVTTIETNAFNRCDSMESVKLPSTLETIDTYAFSWCPALTKITIPDNTAIGKGTFYDCTALQQLTIAGGMTSIGSNAFWNCHGLKTIAFHGAAPASIASDSFTGVTATASYQQGSSWDGKLLQYNGHLTWEPVGETVSADVSWYLTDDYCLYLVGTGDMTSAMHDAWQRGYYADEVAHVYVDEQLHFVNTAWIDKDVFPALQTLHFGSTVRDTRYDNFDGVGIYYDGEVSPAISWAFTPDGTLTLLGSGEIPDYSDFGAPWYGLAKQVKHVVISDDITRIGNCAFYHCAATEVQLPANLATLGNYAFANAPLASLTLPEGLVTIQQQVFVGAKMTEVVLPDSVTSLGFGAFTRCGELTRMTLPRSVTEMDSSSFLNCPNLTCRVYEGSYAHTWCVDNSQDYELIVELPYTYTIENGEVTITGCTGEKTDIEIPAEIEGCPVMKIGDKAFYMCTGLTGVVIPDSVTAIGEGAFRHCIGLENLKLPTGLTALGPWAFHDCTGLTELSLPDGLTTLGESAFRGYVGLTSITLPASLASVSAAAFADCTKLPSIVLPDQVTEICGSAFAFCYALQEVTIPASVTSIHGEAFAGCDELTCRVYAYSYAHTWCVENNQAWTCIEHAVTETVTDVTCTEDGSIVESCTVCGTVISSVKTDDALGHQEMPIEAPPADCVSPGYVAGIHCGRCGEIPPIFEVVDGVLVSCNGDAKNVVIPANAGITKIGDGAFQGQSVTSVEIPVGVRQIGDNAFRNCTALNRVSLPKGLKVIGSAASQGEAAAYAAGIRFIPTENPNFVVDYNHDANPVTLTITEYIGHGSDVVIPASIGGYPVTKVQMTGMSGNTSLNVTIPGSVPGVKVYICYSCGATEEETLEAGHVWRDATLTVMPTETVPGEMTYTWDICGLVKTEPILYGLPGDANDDGLVDMLDVLDALEWYCGGATELNLANTDVNGDGVSDMLDVITILAWYCGEDVALMGPAEVGAAE